MEAPELFKLTSFNWSKRCRKVMFKGVIPYMWHGSRTVAKRKQRSSGSDDGKYQAHRSKSDLLSTVAEIFYRSMEQKENSTASPHATP